ncbi:type II toxin-antitoxin system Phd/YefM family antitoxin [Nonomuraea lactucae]|uniref:type II toxin-antitoxin system Phd/YefM family antitoxin n=1 Tax=Nonomuraea lactucae TaxID=2249762 RepID=UPI0013B42253|nr:type II toxin-antitoxin system Phd/YefM family antitoxin [Nonomuraea lactucae]
MSEAEGNLPEVINAASERGAIAYLTDHGRRVAAIVPADDAWYWTPSWHAAEAEADLISETAASDASTAWMTSSPRVTPFVGTLRFRVRAFWLVSRLDVASMQ